MAIGNAPPPGYKSGAWYVLRALKRAGRRGLTNIELGNLETETGARIQAWRSRVSELREAGHPITAAKRVRQGVYRYHYYGT